ncbi:hypothetical protein ATJ78_0545 [Paramicrobacterium agarici]|uniref:Uncharacterized protein n=2 Tax=Paramicrobacterium agarici TaxID=630514 RepID=A0A2A9DSS1_9MICO|nr:hypothetical protein ATJ78_0545 [Microbacterium agarici]
MYHHYLRWYTGGMPTVLPRFQVTRTDEVERALQIARERWPDATRGELVTRLFTTGAAAVADEIEARRQRRLEAVDFASGILDVAYETDYLQNLREDWPE